jgi:hypothetical protein
MANVGSGSIDVNANPHNMWRNYSGPSTIFIDMRTNPQTVSCSSDIPGDSLNAKITKFLIDDAGGNKKYYQIDFGAHTLHTENCITVGAYPNAIQVIDGSHGMDVDTPVKFLNNHIPKVFTVSIYAPGETGQLIVLGAKGAQIFMQYDFVIF